MKKISIIVIMVLSLFICGCASNIYIVGEDKIELGFKYDYSLSRNGNQLETDEFELIVSNENIVQVDGNSITPLAEGNLIITIYSKDDPTKYASKNITIIEPLVKSISIRGKNTLTVGDEEIYDCYIDPEDTTEDIIWSTSDKSVITVSDGVVKAVGAGEATINVKCSSATSSFNVKVYDLNNGIKFLGKTTQYVNSTQMLEFNINDPVITAKTNNIEIRNNCLYAKSSGKATIHVESKSNSKLKNDIDINIIDGKEEIKPTNDELVVINSYLNSFTMEQKIGQLILLQLSGNYFDVDESGRLYTERRYYGSSQTERVYFDESVSGFPFGNFKYVNNSRNNVSVLDTEIKLVSYLQNYALNNNSIGAMVVANGSQYFNNYAYTNLLSSYAFNLTVGAYNDDNYAQEYFNAMAKECEAVGFTTVEYSAYNKYDPFENFSNDFMKQVTYSRYVNNAFKNTKSGLSMYYYNPEGSDNKMLTQCAFNDGVDCINVSSVRSASELREKGYNGIVICDQQLWSFEDLVFSLECGADMIVVPMNMSSYYGGDPQETVRVINEAVGFVNRNPSLQLLVNEAVERVLLYKIRHGIVDPIYPVVDNNVNINNSLINKHLAGTNTISTSKDFHALKSGKQTYVFSFERANYNFPAKLTDAKKKYGYSGINTYYITKDIFDNMNGINKDDQVVLAAYDEDYYYYEYVDEFGEVQTNVINLDEIYEALTSVCNNVTVLLLRDPTFCYDLFEGKSVVYANYHYDNSFAEIIEVLNGKKANGVTYFDK